MFKPADMPEISRITRLYRATLGRDPDAGGLVTYVASLKRGTPLTDLAALFLNSEEYRASHPSAIDNDTTLAQSISSSVDASERDGCLNVLPVLFPQGMDVADRRCYLWWIAQNDTLSRDDRRRIQISINSMNWRPRITFILLLQDSNLDTMLSAVANLQSQLYSEFDVLIVECSRRDPANRALLERHVTDARMRLVDLPRRCSQAIALRTAMSCAEGDYVAFIDSDDRLAESATYELAAAIARNEKCRIVYSDEDQIDQDGARHSPIFKSEWDVETAAVRDDIGRVAAFEISLLKEIGGPWDCENLNHDMAVRAAEVARDAIIHIPAILCHRKTARRHQQPGGPLVRSRSFLSLAKLRGRDSRPQDDAASSNTHRMLAGQPDACAALARRAPLVSIVIPTRDQVELLTTCVTSILERTAYPAIEIVILDNESSEPSTAVQLVKLALDERVKVLACPGEFNWSALNNSGAKHARGEILVFLNNDTEVLNDTWLHELVVQALRPDVGVVGAKLLYPDFTVQHAGIAINPDGAGVHLYRGVSDADTGYRNSLAGRRTVSGVTGACMAVRRTVFDAVNGFEESNLAVTWNDLDFCFRVRAEGFRVVWTPFARLIHVELATRGADRTPEQKVRAETEHRYMLATWPTFLGSDPYLNPNLEVCEGPTKFAAVPRRRRAWVAEPAFGPPDVGLHNRSLVRAG